MIVSPTLPNVKCWAILSPYILCTHLIVHQLNFVFILFLVFICLWHFYKHRKILAFCDTVSFWVNFESPFDSVQYKRVWINYWTCCLSEFSQRVLKVIILRHKLFYSLKRFFNFQWLTWLTSLHCEGTENFISFSNQFISWLSFDLFTYSIPTQLIKLNIFVVFLLNFF